VTIRREEAESIEREEEDTRKEGGERAKKQKAL
jgi:hypothetical protein